MDLNYIKKLVRIVDESGITDLEVDENGVKVKIAKKIRAANVPLQTSVIPQVPMTAEVIPQPIKPVPEKTSTEESKHSNLHEIKSPIVGTFYRAPAPDADPYVQIGDSVGVGTVLCIIEAMKLMNEIESDVSGKVVKILVENGKPVEFNQPLFLIELS
ncbi:MAG: acetyl-CoA carboxylase biotin carboxyl carrier protein [Ignavibacteriaceae bacterium]|nr:acetyl-CoA carboxylase biotin carboxyl carrier protein [Ignavibacteriaceae bacterium]